MDHVIRHAEFPRDLLAVTKLATEFGQKYSTFPVDARKTAHMLAGLLDSGVCFIAEENGVPKGAIVGNVIDHPFLDARFLVEVGWFSSPRYAYPLLTRFINTGKSLGVSSVTVSTLNNSPRAARVLLERAGLTQVEEVWQMKV